MNGTNNKPSEDVTPAAASPIPDPTPIAQPQTENAGIKPETATDETVTGEPAAADHAPANASLSDKQSDDAPPGSI